MTAEPLCVVLLNYANWRDTVECLESLTRVTHRDLAVVVVDTGSPNDSVKRLRSWVEAGADARGDGDGDGDAAVWSRLPAEASARPRVCLTAPIDAAEGLPAVLPPLTEALTLLCSPRRLGFAAGCNAGLRHALRDPRIDHFWLLNNDTVTAADAPARLLERARALGESLGALGTVIADYREPERIQILGGGRVRRFSAEPMFPAHGAPLAAAAERAAGMELDYVSGASLFTTRSTLRRVGLLDETMHLYWEDTDWGARVRDAGRTLGVCAGAVVWHKGHASTGGINRYTQYHNFRSAAIFMRRHRRLWPLPLLTRIAKTVAREVTKGRPGDAAGAASGLWAGLRTRPTAAAEFVGGGKDA